MKVMIPVVDKSGSKENIASGFISTEYSCIYDCESKSYEWKTAREISPEAGNLSLKLKQQGIKCIISQEMPLLALMLFQDSGLQVYKARGNNLEENVKLFHSNQLEPFTIQSSLSSTMNCASACSSCNTICS
jgi:predicted Fe-Mo cluster-binding NifX family protein